MEREVVIKIENVKKQYRLGTIGGGTLQGDLQSWWAKIRGKEDPNTKIGQEVYNRNQTFMALNGIDFEVYKGERLGIIGGNGAGKSTTLKLLSRVTAPTEGNIYINGRISSMLEVGTGFHPELTGRENIYLNGAILGMSKAEVDSKIEEIIDFSECRQFIDTPVKRYSSGMYVKLAFAVAAHLDSEILVMDEVLAVGDMKFQQKCLGKMSDVAKNDGRTVLYVSHNMNTIRQLCNRCIVLDHGRVVFNGDVEEAIAVYLGMKKQEETVLDVSKQKRDPEFQDEQVLITKIGLIDKKRPAFKVNEKAKLLLEINVKENIQSAYIRIIIKYADGMPVTMVTTSQGITLSKGMNKISLEIDISSIVPGKYSFSPVIYELNEFGTNKSLDGLKEVFMFDIETSNQFNNKMEWNTRYWGFMHGKEIKVLEVN